MLKKMMEKLDSLSFNVQYILLEKKYNFISFPLHILQKHGGSFAFEHSGPVCAHFNVSLQQKKKLFIIYFLIQ